MDAAEQQSLLNQGIRAVRAGDRARGRELLLRVVAADERVEPAWLWLSAALDEPADQLIALENVLALNPTHAQALAGAAALRQKLGQNTTGPTPPPEPPEAAQAGAEPAEAAAGPIQATDTSADLIFAEDDPLQCAYCGRPTVEEDERCPHCRRCLLGPGFWRGGGYQYSLLILVGLQVQAAMVQSAAAYIQTFMPNSIAIVPGAELVAASPLIAAVVRGVLWAIVLMMLLGDSMTAYRWGAVLAAMDLAWQGLGLAAGLVGLELAAANGLLSALIGVIGFSAVVGQAQARLRIRVVPDRGIQSAPLYHQRAEHYARQGMWAMAALHWQKAIGRQPREKRYYKALARAQTRIGRHAQAVRTLRSGAELAPDDEEFEALIQAIRVKSRSS